MKRFLVVIVALLTVQSSYGVIDLGRMTSAGIKALQAAMLTDEQMAQYVSEFVVASDQANEIAKGDNPYNVRLNRIAGAINGKEGLNIKVYITDDVNAFAVADGSIRIFSGLMDVMSDEEILGVIGHEIGHIKLQHSKESFKRALLTSALRDGISSVGGTAALLSDSQIGALGEVLLHSQYSQKQEREADDYGYDFIKGYGLNPWAMAMSFEKLAEMQGSAEYSTGVVQQLFSTHPDINKRIKRMVKRAEKDGYKRPTVENPSSLYIDSKVKSESQTEVKKTTKSSKWSF